MSEANRERGTKPFLKESTLDFCPYTGTPMSVHPVLNLIPPPSRGPRSDKPSDILSWIFVGPAGIRAGWSVLIFFALLTACAVPVFLVMTPLGLMKVQKVATPGLQLGLEVGQLLVVAVTTLLMSLIEGRPFNSYGFEEPRRGPRLLGIGFLLGFAAISLLVGTLYAGRLLTFEGLSLSGGAILQYGILWGLCFLALGFFEESFFRGYLQYTAARGINFWWAVVITSLFFGLAHTGNPGENPFGLVDVVAAGFVFGLSLRLTGSLWLGVGIHAGWDWAQSFFYGVADSGLRVQGHLFSTHPVGNALWSGGSVGPEGSLLALPVEVLLAFGLCLAFRRGTPSRV